MLRIRKADERGQGDHGWLDSRHTFSFADYYDPAQMGFRSLRVIDEDRVQPGRGFPTHPHRDMEIISYVLEGSLEHKDSMGNGSVILPGELQRMSAGSGITHSEYNRSDSQSLHFLQIWILPDTKGLAPEYEQRFFPDEEKRGTLRLIASADGEGGAVRIHQDLNLYAALLDNGEELRYSLPMGRGVWLQVARGTIMVNGIGLEQGDGAAVSEEKQLVITGKENAELLLFDLG